MARTEAAPWLDLAVSRIGTKEKPGKGANNEAILAMFADVGHDECDVDEIAWCAASCGSCLRQTGYTIPPREVNLLARSYLKYGTKLEAPKPGAIGIFPRGKPPFGHVGIVEEVHDDGTVTLVSGNVGNMQKREKKKIDTALGWRWPIKDGEKPPIRADKPVMQTAAKSKSFWAQASAIFVMVAGYVTDWFEQMWSGVTGVVSLLPAVTSETGSAIGSAKTVFSWFNVPWDRVGIAVAAIGMVVVLVRHVQDKRRVGWD